MSRTTNDNNNQTVQENIRTPYVNGSYTVELLVGWLDVVKTIRRKYGGGE